MIVIMGITIYILINDKEAKKDSPIVIQSKIENVSDNNISELKEENVEKEKSEEKDVKEYSIEELVNVIYSDNFYSKAIEEFDSIEQASQDYLFAVAFQSLLTRNTKDSDNLKYEDFNDELVRVFGNKADKLLEKEKIAEDELYYNAETDTFSIIGRGLSENNVKSFIITDIKEDNNKYAITIYEYIWKSVDNNGNLEYIDGASNVWICGLDGKKLLDFTVKEEEGFDGTYSYITHNIYDSKNNLVDNMSDYLKEHVDSLKDKRIINVEYDTENNKYIVISNKIVK